MAVRAPTWPLLPRVTTSTVLRAACGELESAAAVDHADEQLRRTGGAAAGALSTTLVVALLTASPGRARVSLARVGDSTAFVLAGGEEWTELFCDRTAGEAGMQRTATDVLPFAGAGPGRSGTATKVGTGAVIGTQAGADAGGVESASTEFGADMVFVLVTDGVANPLRDGPSTVAPALAEVLRTRPTPLSLAGAADFSRRGAHDDRTILAAWLRNPSGAGQRRASAGFLCCPFSDGARQELTEMARSAVAGEAPTVNEA